MFIFPGPLRDGYYKIYIGNNFRGTTATTRPRIYYEGVIDCFTETVHQNLNVNNALVVRFGNNTNTPTLGSIGLEISLSSAQLTAMGGTTSSTSTGWINIMKLF